MNTSLKSVLTSLSTTGVYTKKTLSDALNEIKSLGWIRNETGKSGDGVPGDILESLLGVPRNNLPIADASGWELKTHRMNSSAMISLSHKEMKVEPKKSVVSKMMLPIFGWRHQEAGFKYPDSELSFRTDIVGDRWNSRGFILRVDESQKRVYVSFDSEKISPENNDWKILVEGRMRTIPFSEPFYEFSDFYKSIGRKFLNCFFVKCDDKQEEGKQFIRYTEAYILEDVNIDAFMKGVQAGEVKIEFDARTGHNHGTKMRMLENDLPVIYSKVTKIM